MSMLLFEVPSAPAKNPRGPRHHYWFGGHHPFMQSWMENWMERNPNDGFELNLNVAHYAPSEIKIKMTGRTLVVEGEHFAENENGSEMRKFQRTVKIPAEFDIDAVTSKLNQSGVLSITAPKLKAKEVPGEKTIPIEMVTDTKEEPNKGQENNEVPAK